MVKLKAVVWPGLRRIASLEMQIEYDCDPGVIRFFSDRFIVHDVPDFEKVTMFEASEKDWADFARAWEKQEPLNRETAKNLH